MELKNVRTRFAPSPTGALHFGNANTALFNWLIARRYGGTVVLRVEDTDLERSTREFEKAIMDDLKWLGIDWDEGPDAGGDFGPYRQSERTDIYEQTLKKLIDDGNAYRCYCTKEELDAERETAKQEKRDLHYSGKCRELTRDDWHRLDSEGKPFTIRFKTPSADKIIVDDLIRGDIVFEGRELDDFIIVRSDGSPVFLLCNAVDDALMNITHVVRGEDHISNTPKQVVINRALGLNVPQYLHTSMILGTDRTKLSKRHGAVSVVQFRELGYLPEALTNYLAFMGWNPKSEREFFSLAELVENFSIEAMGKSPSVFDYDRLKFLNGHWMTQVDRSRVVALCADFAESKGWITHEEGAGEYFAKVVEILGDRIKTLEDFETNADFFFKEVSSYDEKGAEKHLKADIADTLRTIKERLAALEIFSAKATEEAMFALKEEGVPVKKIVHPIRLALSGKTVGPGLFEMLELMGREKSFSRIDDCIKWIKQNAKE